ncbi:WD40-repeat-containing domain protein [Gaertneriomyces semiglobifer]|nr:WD40-repeat-containing domain protein [Gaertneriomyces semiglobifer]
MKGWFRRLSFPNKSPSSPSQSPMELDQQPPFDEYEEMDRVLYTHQDNYNDSAVRTSHGAPAAAAATGDDEETEKEKRRISATDSAFGVDEDQFTRIDFLTHLPSELSLHIMSYLPLSSILTTSLVSHTWNALSSSFEIWKPLYLSRYAQFTSPRTLAVLKRSPRDWKSLWKQRIALRNNWRTSRYKKHVLEGHTDAVYCVQSCDKYIVSGSRDRSVRFWDACPPFGVVKTLTGHQGSVLCLQYSDKWLVTGSSDSTLILWSLATWEKTRVMKGHAAPVLDVRFCEIDGEGVIVSCSKDCTIKVWNFQGQLLETLYGHVAAVNAIHLSGRHLVSASGDCTIKVWDLGNLLPSSTSTSSSPSPPLLSSSAAGAPIPDTHTETPAQAQTSQTHGSQSSLTSTSTSTPTTLRLLSTLHGHTRGLACISFRPPYIISGSNDKTIRIWHAWTGECLKILEGHDALVRTIWCGEWIVSGSYDQGVKVWKWPKECSEMQFSDQQSPQALLSSSGGEGMVPTMGLSGASRSLFGPVPPANTNMTTQQGDSEVESSEDLVVWDKREAHTSWVFHVGGDSTRVVSASQDKKIAIWDFSEGIPNARDFV